MKNLRKKLSYALYTLLVAFTFGCDGGTTRIENKDSYVTVIIEDCEYIYNAMIGEKSMVHKGNCKNEVHKCSCR